MRSWLLVIAVGGNVAVWSMAYIGFTRDDSDVASRQPQRQQVVNLHMFTVLAPTRTYSGRTIGRTPVAVTLNLTDPARVGHVCHMSPRIRDAILQFLFRRPVILGPDGVKELDGLRPHLTAMANRALGEAIIQDVVVEEHGNQGHTARRARFAGLTDCRAVAAEQESKQRPDRRRGELYVPFGRITR